MRIVRGERQNARCRCIVTRLHHTEYRPRQEDRAVAAVRCRCRTPRTAHRRDRRLRSASTETSSWPLSTRTDSTATVMSPTFVLSPIARWVGWLFVGDQEQLDAAGDEDREPARDGEQQQCAGLHSPRYG